MSCIFYFISHPNVLVRPDVPVPDWPLSEEGHSRMQSCLRLPWVASIGAIFSSTERRATDSAAHLARHLSLPVDEVAELAENDRSSTGYLPASEFELVADAFFAEPHRSVRGWERAVDAQARVDSRSAAASTSRETAEATTTRFRCRRWRHTVGGTPSTSAFFDPLSTSLGGSDDLVRMSPAASETSMRTTWESIRGVAARGTRGGRGLGYQTTASTMRKSLVDEGGV